MEFYNVQMIIFFVNGEFSAIWFLSGVNKCQLKQNLKSLLYQIDETIKNLIVYAFINLPNKSEQNYPQLTENYQKGSFCFLKSNSVPKQSKHVPEINMRSIKVYRLKYSQIEKVI